MKKLNLVIEKGKDEEMAGSVDTPDFLFTTVGATTAEIIHNLQSQINDFIKHEGADNAEWEGIKAEEIEFTIIYE